ncbi:AAA family ATPase [Anaeromicropila populeti]|nr:AAA family ATPase [Anaeromicropila populeti]
MGFGISYVLPVIVSLLKAKRDDLIILENPEAHLHPKGQSKMGN